MVTGIEKRVMDEIDAWFDNTVDFLRALVRQPSTLGHEAGAQELVFNRLEEIGLAPEKWDLDMAALRQQPTFGPLDLDYTGRPNVTATWRAAAPGGRSVIFNGHLDVVSPEPLANWAPHGPWGADIVGDWMYGRGAGDMKAGVAAMILAVQACKSAGIGLKGDVTLQCVIEEECTGNGTLACILRGPRADAALVPEPHALSATLATVGVIWFRVRTRGVASHALAADAAVNAIEKTYPLIAALRELEAELNAEPRHPHYAALPHPINLNVGIMRSGDWPSTVPSECTLECRLSCQPNGNVAALQERVRTTIAAAARRDAWLCDHLPEVEFFGFHADPSVVDPGSPALRLLADCHQTIVGKALEFHPSTATTDQRFFINNLNMPATSYGPTAENIHAGNERVLIPSIKQTAQVMALYLMRWCVTAQ